MIPPHVHVVRHVRHKGNELAVEKHWRDHTNIRQMRPTQIRIIGHENVAGSETISTVFRYGTTDQRRHQPQVERDVLCLRNQFTSWTVDSCRAVASIFDVRRVRGANESDSYLLRY